MSTDYAIQTALPGDPMGPYEFAVDSVESPRRAKKEFKQRSNRSKVVAVTGSRGFLATAMLKSQRASKYHVITLARKPPLGDAANVESRCLDLAESTATPDLSGIDTLVHVAAETGKSSRASFDAINSAATRRLMVAARAAGVRRVIYISSVAVRSPLSHLYPYARSKQGGEAAVRDSGIPYAIVRPTFILGPGSPIGAALEKLARLPILPLFGGAAAKVQPIDVDDLAEYVWKLVEQAGEEVTNSVTVEIGGAEILTMRALLLKFRERTGGRPGRSISLPVRWMLRPLYMAESLLLRLLPVTAGQLTGFICDSCCDASLEDTSFISRHDLESTLDRTILESHRDLRSDVPQRKAPLPEFSGAIRPAAPNPAARSLLSPDRAPWARESTSRKDSRTSVPQRGSAPVNR